MLTDCNVMDKDVIRRMLTGRNPDYIRGFLDALKAVGEIDERQVADTVAWATEAAMRRMITGPLGDQA
ncbi:MAG: hypothetical protein FJZ01_07065 [Candidatus Sericytochromatia bacterium]|nr:hypothetical protein [Candidatus Tanganyikabacteria bacterium]